MKDATVRIICPQGLHMRVAAQIVEKSKKFKSKIMLCKDCTRADGCSILQLLLLGATNGSELRIEAAGQDEDIAIQELSSLFTDGGGI
ncbi:MAG: HPr family phosphocarrier protein [Candidatus Aureabacteria bacterium]|nr:HPr family phosphocarrier protein [Candidatus Auribacterota bacterium]